MAILFKIHPFGSRETECLSRPDQIRRELAGKRYNRDPIFRDFSQLKESCCPEMEIGKFVSQTAMENFE
jgi:hypothetical protein